MKTKTIYLLRHGETDYNKKGLVQGRGVDASLNEKGIEQSLAAFEYFKRTSIDRFYTSSLKRTHETIKPFKRSFTPLAGFDEISWGDFEGIEATLDEKNHYKETILSWRRGELHRAIGGGETPIDVMNRQKDAMEEVLTVDEQTILICMHGRAIRILLCWLLNYPLNYMDGFPHQNCAFYGVRFADGCFTVKDFNYSDHLNGLRN